MKRFVLSILLLAGIFATGHVLNRAAAVDDTVDGSAYSADVTITDKPAAADSMAAATGVRMAQVMQ